MSRALLHYSSEMLVSVRDVVQDPADRRYAHKPNGLWLSVEGEDDWPSWCENNWRAWFDEVAHAAEVVLAADAKLLIVDSVDSVLTLSKRFPQPRDGSARDITRDYFRAPDWCSIAREFDGIVIAPYHWSVRLDCEVSWYYTWDCASACVWNSRAVERVVQRPEKLPKFAAEVAS